MTTYKIKNWDKHFENNKSRDRGLCSWCPVPNKQDGLGYGRLLRKENGAALYGAFVAVVLVASKQKCPRDGHLTDTGRAQGIPYTPEDLSVKTQVPTAIIEAMFKAVCDPSIGWIEVYEASARAVPAECPRDALEEKRREEKEEKGGKEEKSPPPAIFGDDGWEMSHVLEIAASPDVGVTKTMAQQCFDHYAAKGWVDSNGNEAGRTISALKSLLRNWKVREPSFSKTHGKTPASPPSVPRALSFDDLVADTARDLWEHRDDDSGFQRVLRTWRDKTKDIPKQHDMSVIDEALDIVKRKRAASKGVK